MQLMALPKQIYNVVSFIGFISPHVMGILNVTPDSFSDGGNIIKDKRLNMP
jgi:dihydropteroate synthase